SPSPTRCQVPDGIGATRVNAASRESPTPRGTPQNGLGGPFARSSRVLSEPLMPASQRIAGFFGGGASGVPGGLAGTMVGASGGVAGSDGHAASAANASRLARILRGQEEQELRRDLVHLAADGVAGRGRRGNHRGAKAIAVRDRDPRPGRERGAEL